MTILDRSIARQYATNVLVLFVVLFSFVVAVDASLNFDRFSERAHDLIEKDGHKASFLRAAPMTVYLIFDFWWPNLVRLFNYLLGLVLVGAMGFTVTQMVRNRELVAVLASGQSLYRVARPIIAVALVLTAAQAATREYVMPRIAPLLTRDQGDAGGRTLGAGHVPLTPDSMGRLWTARQFDADTNALTDLTVWERDEKGRMLRRVVAPSAFWDGQGWVLYGGKADRVRDRFAANDDIPRLDTDLSPTVLTMRRHAGFAQNLSFVQISRLIRSPELLGDASDRGIAELNRIRYGRFGVIACNLLTLIITLRFYLQREPVNMLAQSLRCAPIALVSLMGGVLGAVASIPGMPPQVSPFIPALILLPLAIAAATSVKT